MNDQIRHLCGTLIELRKREDQDSPQSHTVHLVHFSVREYLLRATAINFPLLGTISLSQSAAENDLLSQICVHYLSYNDIAEKKRTSSEAVQKKIDSYRFLRYSARFWFIHAQQSNQWSDSLVELTNRLFEPKGCRSILWSAILDQEGLDLARDVVSPVGLDDVSPLYYASWLGFIHPLRCLQKQALNQDATESEYNNALLAASRNGHLLAVEFVAGQGADVNVANANGCTPLFLAAQEGHLEVVKFLVDKQADINARESKGWTSLHFAAPNGHPEVVKFLVDQKADTNTRNSNGWTLLHLAAWNGHLEVVKFLVNQQAD